MYGCTLRFWRVQNIPPLPLWAGDVLHSFSLCRTLVPCYSSKADRLFVKHLERLTADADVTQTNRSAHLDRCVPNPVLQPRGPRVDVSKRTPIFTVHVAAATKLNPPARQIMIWDTSYLRPIVGVTSCHRHGPNSTSSSHCKTVQVRPRIGHDYKEIYCAYSSQAKIPAPRGPPLQVKCLWMPGST